MKKTIQLSLLSVALLSQANASEAILAPLTISSTAIETDELSSSDYVEIYTSQDIAKANVKNVYEFLNQQTSITTMPSYGNPFTQKLEMRGYGVTDGYQNIVITINGRKMNNIDMVPQLLASIAPSSIEKIEVVKSSGIVQAGDGANAGVINITTKKESYKEVSFYAGDYETFDGSFYFGQSDEKLSLSLSAESQKSGGIREVNDAGEKDASKFTSATFQLSYLPIDSLELRANANVAKMDVTYASSLTQEQYEEDATQTSTSFSPSTNQLFDASALGLGVSYFVNDSLSLKVDANHEYKYSEYASWSLSNNYHYNSLKTSLDYISDDFALVAGYDGFYADRKGSGAVTSKNNDALFLMGEFYLSDLTLKAGYRFEKVSYEYDKEALNLKDNHKLHGAEIGANYKINDKNSLVANYSRSYQAPDIDRFFTTTYPAPDYVATVGFNEFIEPSEANNYSLGYNCVTSDNKLKISAYYASLKNEIYYYPGVNYVGDKNTNIDKSHKYGFDFYDKFIASEYVNVIVNYNYVKAIIDKERENGEVYDGNELPGVSNHNFKATLNVSLDKHSNIGLTHKYRSRAFAADDLANDFAQKQDAYRSTDLSANYAKDNWEIFAKINNLFDQKNALWIQDDAIYPVDFTRTVLAGLKLKY
jgi:iron complex outermembrane receptor protein